MPNKKCDYDLVDYAVSVDSAENLIHFTTFLLKLKKHLKVKAILIFGLEIIFKKNSLIVKSNLLD